MRNNKAGFTLVEIMVVMAIVSLLVSAAIVEGVGLRKQANEVNAQTNLKTISTCFEMYAVRHGGVYAEADQDNLQFLIDDIILSQDFTTLIQVGNFRYIIAMAGPQGYDIRAMAVNPMLADHNYQIVTVGTLRRSDTSGPEDTDFKVFR